MQDRYKEIEVIPARMRTIPVNKIQFLDYSISGQKLKIILDSIEIHIWEKTNMSPEKVGEFANLVHQAIGCRDIYVDIPQDLSSSYYGVR